MSAGLFATLLAGAACGTPGAPLEPTAASVVSTQANASATSLPGSSTIAAPVIPSAGAQAAAAPATGATGGSTNAAHPGTPTTTTSATTSRATSRSVATGTTGTTAQVTTSSSSTAVPPPASRSTSSAPPSSSGGRAGAPYDILAIDVVGGSGSDLDDVVNDRCPNGTGPSCLIVKKKYNQGADRSDPTACTVVSIVSRPPAKDDMLQRGATVTFTLQCPTEGGKAGEDQNDGDKDEDGDKDKNGSDKDKNSGDKNSGDKDNAAGAGDGADAAGGAGS